MSVSPYVTSQSALASQLELALDMPQSHPSCKLTEADFEDIELRLFGLAATYAEGELKEVLDMDAAIRAALEAQDCVPTFEEFDCAIRKSCE